MPYRISSKRLVWHKAIWTFSRLGLYNTSKSVLCITLNGIWGWRSYPRALTVWWTLSLLLLPGLRWLPLVITVTISSMIQIIIIILSRHQHGYPWPSFATTPYLPLLPPGLQGSIPYRHRAAVCRFELVVLRILGYVKGSIGVHYLWTRSYFSSSVPHVWFV